MRVLHISSSDSYGGAARSAVNLHMALIQANIDSHYFAAEKTAFVPKSTAFRQGYIVRRLLALIDALPFLSYPQRSRDYPFTNNYFPYSAIKKQVRKLKPDIIHFHWLGKGMFRLEQMSSFGVPVVWTMHDNYPFTGGCHLVNGCTKFTSECNSCPQLASHRTRDLSFRNFRRKAKTYKKSNITFIAPSKWMMSMAVKSPLLLNKSTIHIPNLIHVDQYFPLEKSFARKALNIPAGQKVLIFGAVNSTTDVNKGFVDLLKIVSGELFSGVTVCVFGANAPDKVVNARIKYLGYLNDHISKRVMYSAADAVVVPSRIENLSNVIMEAMCCGTAVVAFDTGGNSDMIEHLSNGYLAKLNDVNDLEKGIHWAISESGNLGVRARKKIEHNFSSTIVSEKHILLYQKLIDG